MPKMFNPSHARVSDPTPSHESVDQLVNKSKLPDLLREIILSFPMNWVFNDSILTEEVNKRYNRNEQRGNVARCRLSLERLGLVLRADEHEYNGVKVTGFKRAPAGTPPLAEQRTYSPKVKELRVTNDFKFEFGSRLSDYHLEIDDGEIRLVCNRTRRKLAANERWFLDQLFKQAMLHDKHYLGGSND
jgi:hypothetical protein